MQHSFEGVTVDVISEGKTLELYDDPDEEASARICQRYVEAVTATFKVKVSVHKHFQSSALTSNDAVHVVIHYDGQEPGWYIDLTKDTLLSEWSKGRPAEHTFSYISTFCQETQQWKQGATSFASLTINETPHAQISHSDVHNLGKIQVKITRVHRIPRLTPIHTTKRTQKPITEVTEKILKGKAITDTVRVTDEIPAREPPPTLYDHVPVHGEHGQPLIFNILYRSKHTLQMLGCIPRTPSPEPEPATRFGSVTSREQKVRDLRAQLALLEGAGNVKVEGSGSGSGSTVKRQREDKENTGSRKRSRTSGPIETIDLTGD